MQTPHKSSLSATQKKAYQKPKLVKHGRVAKLTLKGGSAFDALTNANTLQL